MALLRWLVNLVIIVGYFAAAFVLGSWLMIVAPIALAIAVIVATVGWVRLGDE